MSVLQSIRDMAPEVSLSRPDSVFGQTGEDALRLQVLVRDVAEMIRDAHPWTELAFRNEFIGDGAAASFAYPADFDRVDKATQIWTSRLLYPMQRIMTLDHWNEIIIRDFDYTSGAWINYAGRFHFSPIPASGERLSFFYQVKNIWRDQSGTPKEDATADSDVFRLPERLLTLGLIWRWRSTTGQPYAEEMATFQDALAQEIQKDKPSEMLILGRTRQVRGARVAYPLTVE